MLLFWINTMLKGSPDGRDQTLLVRKLLAGEQISSMLLCIARTDHTILRSGRKFIIIIQNTKYLIKQVLLQPCI